MSSALVSLEKESCSSTGAGEGESILAILAVKVKSKRSEKTLETYAFMAPGSLGTFCTETLMRRLYSYLVSDLEVCGLEEKEYIDLPRVYTQKSIPVRKENIPHNDTEKWPYLSEVHLPTIDAEIGLLIGTRSVYVVFIRFLILN